MWSFRSRKFISLQAFFLLALLKNLIISSPLENSIARGLYKFSPDSLTGSICPRAEAGQPSDLLCTVWKGQEPGISVQPQLFFFLLSLVAATAQRVCSTFSKLQPQSSFSFHISQLHRAKVLGCSTQNNRIIYVEKDLSHHRDQAQMIGVILAPAV